VIIDAHCHVWPDHIAKQVVANRPTGMDPKFDGTLRGLLATMDEAGVDKGLALGIAAVPRTVARTNEFIGQVPRDRLIPFGTVHPELSAEENLRHLRDNGIGGVKLHPLFQDFDFSSPKVHELIAALVEADIAIITHVGAGGDEEGNRRGNPAALREVLDRNPGMRLVAFHYGGYQRIDEAREHLIGSDAYLETSWPPSIAELDPDMVRGIIEDHGADRIVFGSDWPMTSPADEIAAIRNLGLSPEDEAGILGGNLARLLRIEG
jgi:uncharacterized protein